MSARPFVIGVSLLAHGGLVYALGEISVAESLAATAIEVFDSPQEKKEAEKPKPVEVEPPPPQVEAPKQRSANPTPAEAPPPDSPPPSNNPLADLPDFGLELGGSGGPGGFAIAQGTGPIGAKPRPVVKSLAEATPAPVKAADTCAEGPAKPKLLHLPQPTYTEAARAAGIEGKVRVQITVDETGQVVETQVLSSLGHGLDEAAIAAAKTARFEAAVRCGRPSRSTFTISIRFSAS